MPVGRAPAHRADVSGADARAGRARAAAWPVAPDRAWRACLALDAKGFIKTGLDLSDGELQSAGWPLARRPQLLETTLPGVFAVGDVRAGNVKRVASAVGEGSVSIAFVHQALSE